ncbi:sporulation histidine kinase inhibitor Sda [Robertmurraya andreesenii]
MKITSLISLSDTQLVDVFSRAIECGLEEEFIQILDEELKRRGLEIKRIS